MPIVKKSPKKAILDLSNLPNARKVQLALDAYNAAGGPESGLKLRALARRYLCPYNTLRDRVNGGAMSKAEANEAKQRLTPAEELGILKEVLQLGAWGWPPLIPMLQRMGQVSAILYRIRQWLYILIRLRKSAI
jgi:hypothetical protein